MACATSRCALPPSPISPRATNVTAERSGSRGCNRGNSLWGAIGCKQPRGNITTRTHSAAQAYLDVFTGCLLGHHQAILPALEGLRPRPCYRYASAPHGNTLREQRGSAASSLEFHDEGTEKPVVKGFGRGHRHLHPHAQGHPRSRTDIGPVTL